MKTIINIELVNGPNDGEIIEVSNGVPNEITMPCTVSATPHSVIYTYRSEQGSGSTIKYDFKEYRPC